MPMSIETIRRLWNETLEAFAETEESLQHEDRARASERLERVDRLICRIREGLRTIGFRKTSSAGSRFKTKAP